MEKPFNIEELEKAIEEFDEELKGTPELSPQERHDMLRDFLLALLLSGAINYIDGKLSATITTDSTSADDALWFHPH